MSTATTPRTGNRLILILASVSVASLGCCGCPASLAWYAVASFEIFVISNDGMYPEFPSGSRLIARRDPYSRPADVKRGDIVIFSRTENGAERQYIWRVVGLPGDRIQTTLHSVQVNGKQLPLVRSRIEGGKTIYFETNGSAQYEIAHEEEPDRHLQDVDVVVPADQFFLMGDNRHHASDSRAQGTIPFASIKGKKW